MTPYVMNRKAAEESQRMFLLEEWADAGTIQCLETIDVRPGWRCLEAGAGAGSIARWLCRRVSPKGEVVATDLDCSLLATNECANLEVRTHDIVTDSLPESFFDLVHARLLLEHLPERKLVLEKLVSSLKPGGWLVVEDQDIVSVSPAFESAGMNQQFMVRSSALLRLLTAAGVDLEYGRRLYSELRGQNLVEVSAEGRVNVVRGGTPEARYWRLTWEQLRPQLVRSRLLSEWDVEEFIELLNDPNHAWLSPTIVAAWGRRPEMQ